MRFEFSREIAGQRVFASQLRFEFSREIAGQRVFADSQRVFAGDGRNGVGFSAPAGRVVRSVMRGATAARVQRANACREG